MLQSGPRMELPYLNVRKLPKEFYGPHVLVDNEKKIDIKHTEEEDELMIPDLK